MQNDIEGAITDLADRKQSTNNLNNRSFFGPLNTQKYIRIKGQKNQNLRELLNESSNDNILDAKKKINLSISKKDIMKLLQGKSASKEFILDNINVLNKHTQHIFNKDGEQNFQGFQEWSDANMLMLDMSQKNLKMSIKKASQNKDQNLNDSINQQSNYSLNNIKPYDSTNGIPDIITKLSKQETGNLPKILSTTPSKKKKKTIGESRDVSSKVMENWLNETLGDAEHLDIPGVILKPEHQNHITRYGLDRIELTNNGIPNEFVDRIYRCLFVYSVGFYEMLKKIIMHSNQKHSIITKIWKVFSIILEYCCQSDYKMMIQKITQQHEEQAQELAEDYEKKLEQLIQNEKILKFNIASLQKKNEELDTDNTNERTLRIRLEDEYMQNTKNHEEEVQLRLKFESKLNTMHIQSRETDIKFNRCLEELKQANIQINTIENKLYQNQFLLHDNNAQMLKQQQEIDLLIEQKLLNEQDLKNKSALMSQINERNQEYKDESNNLRYDMGQLRNLNNRLTLDKELLDSRFKALETKHESLEAMFQDANEGRTNYEEKTKVTREKYDHQLVYLSLIQKKQDQNDEIVKQKLSQIYSQQITLEFNATLIENLLVIKLNSQAEIDTLNKQLERLKADFEESAENLHKINRYRHELELRFQAEKLIRDQQDVIIVEKDEIITDFKNKLEFNMQKVAEKEQSILFLMQRMAEQKFEYDTVVNKLSIELQEVGDLIKNERVAKEQWAKKFQIVNFELSDKQQNLLTLQQEMTLKDFEINDLKLKLESMMKTLEIERQEREIFEQSSIQSLQDLKIKEEELSELLQVSRQLEKQRHSQYKIAELQMTSFQNLVTRMNIQHAIEIEDYESQLLRIKGKMDKLQESLDQYIVLNIKLQEQIKKNEQQNILENDRNQMHIEDLYKNVYNYSHLIELKNFKIMEQESEWKQLLKKNQQFLQEIETLKFTIKNLQNLLQENQEQRKIETLEQSDNKDINQNKQGMQERKQLDDKYSQTSFSLNLDLQNEFNNKINVNSISIGVQVEIIGQYAEPNFEIKNDKEVEQIISKLNINSKEGKQDHQQASYSVRTKLLSEMRETHTKTQENILNIGNVKKSIYNNNLIEDEQYREIEDNKDYLISSSEQKINFKVKELQLNQEDIIVDRQNNQRIYNQSSRVQKQDINIKQNFINQQESQSSVENQINNEQNSRSQRLIKIENVHANSDSSSKTYDLKTFSEKNQTFLSSNIINKQQNHKQSQHSSIKENSANEQHFKKYQNININQNQNQNQKNNRMIINIQDPILILSSNKGHKNNSQDITIQKHKSSQYKKDLQIINNQSFTSNSQNNKIIQKKQEKLEQIKIDQEQSQQQNQKIDSNLSSSQLNNVQILQSNIKVSQLINQNSQSLIKSHQKDNLKLIQDQKEANKKKNLNNSQIKALLKGAQSRTNYL